MVIVLLGFAFEAKSAGLCFQGADFGMDVTAAFATTLGQHDSHRLLLRRSRSRRFLDVDRGRRWGSWLSDVDRSWRRSRCRVADVDGLRLRWRWAG
jgi:hypothetical protein